MIRVLFSISYYTPYLSGLTLYVKRLAEALQKKGFQVSVISNQYNNDLREQETINGIEIYRARPLFAISKGFLSVDFVKRSWQMVQEQDVVFVNLPQFEGLIPAIFAKIFGKKLIVVYHCEVKMPGSLINLFIETTLNISNWLTLLLSDRVITYTEDFARHSLILSLFRYKIKTVYPPIKKPIIDKRVQKLIMDKIPSFAKASAGKGIYLIGVAARLAAEKGIEHLLESIPIIEEMFSSSRAKSRDLPNSGKLKIPPRAALGRNDKNVLFKIIVAGSMDPAGEEKYKRKILKLVEKYKEYIVFLGELPEEKMGSFYSLLDVLVLPSVNSTEAFGMVQVEAMMAGVPVVASNLPGVRVPIEKTGMGLVVPVSDTGKLAEAITEIIRNKKKYIKDSKLIDNEFSINKTIRFYEELFK